MTFPKLLEVALVGTLRQEPPAGLVAHEQLSAENRLLRGASYEGMRRLAGRPPERVEDAVSIEPAPPEVLAEVPPATEVRLHEILDEGPTAGLIREWLQLAVARKLRVPPLSLSDLLDYARTETDADLHDLIAQVGGERMAWLAGLNPDWQFAAYADPEQQFARGSRDERAVALRRIRRQDAGRGRALLQDLWPAERGDARPKLLDALTIGLSDADEPFLDQAVRDPRKEVRQTALRLIRRIPNSRFGQRWVERARQVISLKQGRLGWARLEVHAPAQMDPEWVADGLDPLRPKGMGVTAWLLQQIMALTPPSIWPRAALGAIDHTDWPKLLRVGLAQAAEAYADGEWCEALLVLWSSTTEHREQLGLSHTGLFATLDPARAEAVLRRMMEQNTALAGSLVGARTDPWSESFSRFLVQQLPRLLEDRQNSVVGLLLESEARLDPRVLPDLERLVDAQIESIGARSALDRLVRRLDYRAAMHKEFK
jgi:hypothetical protein